MRFALEMHLRCKNTIATETGIGSPAAKKRRATDDADETDDHGFMSYLLRYLLAG